METTRSNLIAAVIMGALFAGAGHVDAKDVSGPETCIDKVLTGTEGDVNTDLIVSTPCEVRPSTHTFRHVYLVGPKGTLTFKDGPGETHVYARTILIENGGTLAAGTPQNPFGSKGGRLTIHLYGEPQNPGAKAVPCHTDAQCGAPDLIWKSNVDSGMNPVPVGSARRVQDLCNGLSEGEKPACQAIVNSYPGPKDDYFYAYHPLAHDDGDHTAYFGNKALGVGYGGSVQLFGTKGALYCSNGKAECDTELKSWNAGTSWVFLNQSAKPTTRELFVDKVFRLGPNDRQDEVPLDWGVNDEIVVTTTDYLPGHSEKRTISEPIVKTANGWKITVSQPLTYHHNGESYQLPTAGIDRLHLEFKEVDTRAAVALLSRSIRIVSEDGLNGNQVKKFPTDDECKGAPSLACHFGGHTVVRQGFASFQVQGVEFTQLGQGGRLGHYPVHFHHARKTPPDTFVKDSSINESMTRWIVLHGTHDVLLQRNVGFKSIGHGFYLEDGTEINNRLFSNIGIYARGAVMAVDKGVETYQRDNPRRVPGILGGQFVKEQQNFPFHSDADHPAVFWIMNGWNDFAYNMAAGAGTCGACYWLVQGGNSGHSKLLKWESYASLQATPVTDPPVSRTEQRDARTGLTPLRTFVGNSCTSAMNSFVTVGHTAVCQGILSVFGPSDQQLKPIPNPLAPVPPDPTAKNSKNEVIPIWQQISKEADEYYPLIAQNGGRFATECGGPNADPRADCSQLVRCDNGAALTNCRVTILDGYTTSFHWPEVNQSAIWLRPQWYLVRNSAITDVQGGGLSAVTGGGYTESDAIQGHWALVRRSAFIGHTQKESPVGPKNSPYPENRHAAAGGPFNPQSGLTCTFGGNYCLSLDEAVSFPINNHLVNQRLFHIYDGPSYQDSNAYLDITRRIIEDCSPQRSDDPNDNHNCVPSAWLAGKTLGLPRGEGDTCHMPNAAIGWKQPNGFYYPPAFHSTNLFFNNVDIRHYVISPLHQAGKFKTDQAKARDNYCTYNIGIFDNFTDVDRQTELSDDDGSLTGYVKTISVNTDPFFKAPAEAFECASDGLVKEFPLGTAKTSPYDHVTTVVYPQCATNNTCFPIPPHERERWDKDCTNPSCYGVPLYRQLLTASERASCGTTTPSIRLAGQATFQRSSLTVNHGDYYIDTTVGPDEQQASGAGLWNVFRSGQVYYTLLLWAKPTLASENPETSLTKTRQTYRLYVGTGFDVGDVWATRGDIRSDPIKFKAAGATAWPSSWPAPAYEPSTGVLTVTMDMGFTAFSTDYDKALEDRCKPATFCSYDSINKKCNGTAAAKLTVSDADAVCAWSIKDVDCPQGGCYGFGVKLGNVSWYPATRPLPTCTPVTGDPRPKPEDFPNGDDYWNVTKLVKASSDIGGTCP